MPAAARGVSGAIGAPALRDDHERGGGCTEEPAQRPDTRRRRPKATDVAASATNSTVNERSAMKPASAGLAA